MNQLLADELTAISEYMAHAEMCEEWGYLRLHDAIEAQAKDEMKHAEKLVKRILFLGGMPVMNKLNAIKIGKDVAALLARTQEDEDSAIEAYNRGVKLAREYNDESTAHLLGRDPSDRRAAQGLGRAPAAAHHADGPAELSGAAACGAGAGAGVIAEPGRLSETPRALRKHRSPMQAKR